MALGESGAMREVDAQLEMAKAVREAGGEGTKLSNRFLIGVADLLLKLPDQPPALIEAKMADVVRVNYVYVEPTTIQLRWLNDWKRAGMMTGVMSCITRKRHFGVRFIPISEWDHDASVRVLTDAHAWCPMGPASRMRLMMDQFEHYVEEHK